MVFGTVSTEDDKKREVSKEARKLRENMVGFVDSIIERQDRYDILKRMESFQIEQGSRRALKELVNYYTKED